MDEPELRARIAELAGKAHLSAVAVAVRDFGSDQQLEIDAERSFHAASTYKAGILLALLKEASEGRVDLGAHLHVRNRFVSVVEGAPTYRIAPDRDGDQSVHQRVGRSLTLRTLAHRMITRSSNLATNLLLDFLTVSRVQEDLAAAGIEGLRVRRGVEDMAAFEAGIINETNARALVQLFTALQGGDFLPEACRQEGLEILLEQEFRSMLPARLPKGVRVAHKTGEISTHGHDAGLVFPPERPPYAVAILTEHEAGLEGRAKAVAEMSRAVYDWVTGAPEGGAA